ncbi:MarR family winged helix-turn-helix transcriptional regulator [Demequina oxidasica]|uniref:MarR family winged helix-turn-helix transcriptional regulator n=1 Tax=Demequina oxidasica TaxID=676199 RepID=UPI000782CBEA|nr:MarR family transcriptional regulator [Demequina oxidasica]
MVESIFADLVRVEIQTWNVVDTAVRREAGVSLGDYEGLKVIEDRRTSRVNQVAEDLVITVGGASKLADRLERAGLLIRRQNAEDRRSSVLELTDHGTAVLNRAARVVSAELHRYFDASITAEELHKLGLTLRKLRKSAAVATETPSAKSKLPTN